MNPLNTVRGAPILLVPVIPPVPFIPCRARRQRGLHFGSSAEVVVLATTSALIAKRERGVANTGDRKSVV